MTARAYRSLACSILALILAGCEAFSLTNVADVVSSYDASWLSASWSGGRVGPPNDAKSPQKTDAPGRACAPDSNFLGSMYPRMDNHQQTPGHLTVINNCIGLTVEELGSKGV